MFPETFNYVFYDQSDATAEYTRRMKINFYRPATVSGADIKEVAPSYAEYGIVLTQRGIKF